MERPLIIETVHEMQAFSRAARIKFERVTLVPTMGYLHAGHASLIRRARRDGDVVVVSLFVNPTQFGPKEDYRTYPRDFDHDLDLVRECGGDVVFTPSVEEMYPEGFSTFVDVDGVKEGLCGASRPGHFRGVATVVTKLFTAVLPHAAVFGQKDAQQVRVIERLNRDLNLGVEILVSPTVRDPDGLARSSRNKYLSEAERRSAPALYAALLAGRRLVEEGERDPQVIVNLIRSRLQNLEGTEIDYIEVVDADSLKVASPLGGRTLLALAVKFGEARLIDNVLVSAESDLEELT